MGAASSGSGAQGGERSVGEEDGGYTVGGNDWLRESTEASRSRVLPIRKRSYRSVKRKSRRNPVVLN